MGGRRSRDCNCNLYICPVVVYNERNFAGCVSLPHRKGDAFPTPEEGIAPIKYIIIRGVFFWNFPRLGMSMTVRGYPSADSRPIRDND
ncbi:hypothetical protein TNCV_1738791 [Trichonephila clavipes]|nr:hypothetical protein TNCV_1738791 [Trichonephila clavipes]